MVYLGIPGIPYSQSNGIPFSNLKVNKVYQGIPIL